MPREVPQPPGNLPVRCAWCGRLRSPTGWVHAAEEIRADGATHGICPSCFTAHTSAGAVSSALPHLLERARAACSRAEEGVARSRRARFTARKAGGKL